MNEIINTILQFFFHLSQNVPSLDLFKHETADECRKTFKESHSDKRDWM